MKVRDMTEDMSINWTSGNRHTKPCFSCPFSTTYSPQKSVILIIIHQILVATLLFLPTTEVSGNNIIYCLISFKRLSGKHACRAPLEMTCFVQNITLAKY